VRIPKITLPSPGLFANFWSPELSRSAYPTLDSFLADIVDLLRAEVEELARLGATYVQIDAPHYTLLLDPKTRAFYESRGWSLKRWLAAGVDLDNALMYGLPDVTFGFHLCRGNQASRWLVEGGYDPSHPPSSSAHGAAAPAGIRRRSVPVPSSRCAMCRTIRWWSWDSSLRKAGAARRSKTSSGASGRRAAMCLSSGSR
jgi:hypothetical protein